MKKVCVLTGTRAEYGLLKPILEQLVNHRDIELQIVVTGMHVLQEYGHTIDIIRKDGFNVDKEFIMQRGENSGEDMAKSISIGISKSVEVLKDLKPDLVLVLGDRVEPFSFTIAASFMHIAVAHIHGGDTSMGGLDESMRHAITKFAHIHFPATELSAKRIKRLGEDNWRIHVCGAPALDTILHKELFSIEETYSLLGLTSSVPYILALQHPVTTQISLAKEQINTTIDALKREDLTTVFIYPNSDAGGKQIISALDELENDDKFIIKKNLDHKLYLSALKYCTLLIGNSSSGMIESSSFKVPVINIGIRQIGRECAANVVQVDHQVDEITKAIQFVLKDNEFINSLNSIINPFGDGRTGEKITRVIADLKITEELFTKKMNY